MLRSAGHWAAVLPVPAAFILIAIIVLLANSPASKTTDYGPSIPVLSGVESDYAVTAIQGGYGVVAADPRNRLVLRSHDGHGPTREKVLDESGADDSMISAASIGSSTLVVWIRAVNSATSDLVGRMVRNGVAGKPFVIAGPEDTVEHPDVFIYQGHFDIIYSQGGAGATTIWLASLRSDGAVAQSREVIRAQRYGFGPRAIEIGSGRILVLYLNLHCCKPENWEVRYAVLAKSGRMVENVRVAWLPELSGTTLTSVTMPAQWGLALAPAADGRTWGAWEANDSLYAGLWSPAGRPVSRQMIHAGAVNEGTGAVTVLPTSSGAILAVSTDAGIQSDVTGIRLTKSGLAASIQRADFEQSGTVLDPVGLIVNGTPKFFWEFQPDQGDGQQIMSASYGRQIGPSLVDRLGLNGGNPWFEALFIAAGSTFGALALTLLNAFVVLPLAGAWLLVSRIPREAWRWMAYVALIGVVLLLVYGMPTFATRLALMMGAQQLPLGLIVVGGAVFAGFWLGRALLRDEDAFFRAATTAAFSVYFVAFMWLVIQIQGAVAVS